MRRWRGGQWAWQVLLFPSYHAAFHSRNEGYKCASITWRYSPGRCCSPPACLLELNPCTYIHLPHMSLMPNLPNRYPISISHIGIGSHVDTLASARPEKRMVPACTGTLVYWYTTSKQCGTAWSGPVLRPVHVSARNTHGKSEAFEPRSGGAG